MPRVIGTTAIAKAGVVAHVVAGNAVLLRCGATSQSGNAHSHVAARLRCWEGERGGRQHQPLWRRQQLMLLLLLIMMCPLQCLRQPMLIAMSWLMVLTQHRRLCLRELPQHLFLRTVAAVSAASPFRSPWRDPGRWCLP